MTKSQIFKNMRLHPVAMAELDKYLIITIFTSPHSTNFELVTPSSIHWRFDTIDQFLAEYPRSLEALYQRASGPYEIEIVNSYEGLEVFSQVTVRAPTRDTIKRIFELIEACRKVSTIVLKAQPDGEEQLTQPST